MTSKVQSQFTSMPESTATVTTSTGSSFFTGLTLGVVVGVAGYYFFGTKEGQQAREKISKEWSQAQKLLDSSTAEQAPDTEKWQQFFTQMAHELGFQRQRQKNKLKATTKTSVFVKKTKQLKKAATKFTGV